MNAPVATYRVQLNENFGFLQLKEIVPYLAKLGISHIYASPIFEARKGSQHGYDVMNPNRISEELGGREAFEDLTKEVSAYGLGWIQDIVPNHTAYATQNPAIADIMAQGASSSFYRFIDNDWNHPTRKLKGKILAPFLENSYRQCLSNSEFKLVYHDGFFLKYKSLEFPVRRDLQNEILADVSVQQALEKYNGNQFLLDQLVQKQIYTLAHWRTALRHITYRRFFDITDLICLRTEDEEVFEHTHQLIFALMDEGKFSGVRMDHVDGLLDPQEYIERFCRKKPEVYSVVEKILTGVEQLPQSWRVQGTTGYDFINQVNRLFVDARNEQQFDELYKRFIENDVAFSEVLYECKKLIIEKSFQGDFSNLARLLFKTLKKRPFGNNLTSRAVRAALVELFALFPVYRAYLNPKKPADESRASFIAALSLAIEKSPSLAVTFRAIEALLDECEHFPDALAVFMRLQQYTGVVMAKGFEDTTLYRYCRLLSLNEVGGEPAKFGSSIEEFHKLMSARQANWPFTLSASSTHDTKRGEDARARLNVLSEVPSEFEGKLNKWRGLNGKRKKDISGKDAPNLTEEYYLYQTLLGSYPFTEDDLPEFIERVKAHIIKALREAKVNTSWLRPNQEYERAVSEFAAEILNRRSDFLTDFLPFQRRIAFYGGYNSLAQTLIKITSPGIPDFYQGAELWDLNMVDPDNRRPVNFQKREQLLDEISSAMPTNARRWFENSADGRVKLYEILKALEARKRERQLFEKGTYIPIQVSGAASRSVIAFCRKKGDVSAITIAPRFLASFPSKAESAWHFDWKDTTINLPTPGSTKWMNAFSPEPLTSEDLGNRRILRLQECFRDFPVALLFSR